MVARALAVLMIVTGCADLPSIGMVITNAPSSMCSPSKPGGGGCP